MEKGLPKQRIVLETYASDQLSELCIRPLEELFQFCTSINSQRTDTVAGPPFDQISTAENFELPFPNDGHPFNVGYGEYICPSAHREQFGPYEGEQSPHLNTFINSYLSNTSADISALLNHHIFPAHPADMPRDSLPLQSPELDLDSQSTSNVWQYGDMSNSMMLQTGNDQDGIVNPKDLVQAPV